MKITDRLRTWAKGVVAPADKKPAKVFVAPVMPAGVDTAASGLAMDSAFDYMNTTGCSGESFPGYPWLSEMMQYPEYRMLAEKIPEAMCRKWIKFTTSGDGDKSEKIALIEAEFKRLKVRALFKQAAAYDNFFGRCQLFADFGQQEGPELAMPLIMASAKIGVGSLKRLTLVEPVTTYPAKYNSTNPLDEDYYKPSVWMVMATQVHASRMLTFVSRPVPNMLKPAYNFGGLSMTQMSRVYVENWLRTRTSVSRLISNFSTTGLVTNMGASLAGGDGDDIIKRAEVFTGMRDNQGLFLLDSGDGQNEGAESLVQLNVPLSGLDALQAQAQEHLASVSSTPLSVLTGITPQGLNASSEGEIRIFYDHVHAMQESVFTDNLTRTHQMVQLSLFGKIDPDIVFEYVPLWQQTDAEKAVSRKSDAECAMIYLEMGAISPAEVRSKLAADPDSGYTGLVGVIEEPTPEPDEGEE